jgi:hypothetical protein
MIVPAVEVQTAPQMVEVQGAPSAPLAAPEFFRAAFAASVARSVPASSQSRETEAAGSVAKSGAVRAGTSKAASAQTARAAAPAALSSSPPSKLALVSSTKTSPVLGSDARGLLAAASSKANGPTLADANKTLPNESVAAPPAEVSNAYVAASKSAPESDVKENAEVELAEAIGVAALPVAPAVIEEAASPRTTTSAQHDAVTTAKDNIKRASASPEEATANTTGTPPPNAAAGAAAPQASDAAPVVALAVQAPSEAETIPLSGTTAEKRTAPSVAAMNDARVGTGSAQALVTEATASSKRGDAAANDPVADSRTPSKWASAIAEISGALGAESNGTKAVPVKAIASEVELASNAKPTIVTTQATSSAANAAGANTSILQEAVRAASEPGVAAKQVQTSGPGASVAQPHGSLRSGSFETEPAAGQAAAAGPGVAALPTAPMTGQAGERGGSQIGTQNAGQSGGQSNAAAIAPSRQESTAVSDEPTKTIPNASASPAAAGKLSELKHSQENAAATDSVVAPSTGGADTASGHTSGTGPYSGPDSGSASAAAQAANVGCGAAVTAQGSVPAAASSVGHAVTPVTVAMVSSPVVHAMGAQEGIAARLPGATEKDTSVYAASSDTHQTISATPTSLEVGVRSGTEGWLRIRAEVGGEGEVKASLSAASDGGQAMLERQLPALNAYLHSEQMAVTTTVSDRSFSAATSNHGGAPQERQGGYRTDGYAGTGGSGGSFAQGGSAGESRQQQALTPQITGVASTAALAQRGWTSASDGVSPLAIAHAAQAVAFPDEAFENGQWLNVRV